MRLVSFDEAAKLLLDGAVGVIPSDTVYGLMTSAFNEASVERFYALKAREHKPGTLIAANVDQLAALGIDSKLLRQIAHFWPNPLSIILPTPKKLGYLTQAVDSLACRIPADEKLRLFLERTGPLITSSANQPGASPAESVQAAEDYFGRSVDFYVDGGLRAGNAASTIIRLNGDKIEIIRQGAYRFPS